jgi:hypothetical protein
MSPTTSALWAQFLQLVLPALGLLIVAVCSVGTLAVYNWGQTRGLRDQVAQQQATGDRRQASGAPVPVQVVVPPLGAASAAAPLGPPPPLSGATQATCPHCGAAVLLAALGAAGSLVAATQTSAPPPTTSGSPPGGESSASA